MFVFFSFFFFFVCERGSRNLPVAIAEEETGTGREEDCAGEIDKFSCSKVIWDHIRSLHTTLLHGET